jgi:glycerol uptake facilitator protein
MTPYLAEFVGTALLILFSDGVVANVLLNRSNGNNSGWIVITAGWGLAVMIAVYSVGTISGAHLNPAVTVGLAAIGKSEMTKVPGCMLIQLSGAMVGAFLVCLAYLLHWTERAYTGAKLAVFCTAPAIRQSTANIQCEIIGAAALVFGALAIPSSSNLSEPGWATGFGPLLVGLLVFAIGLSLGDPAGYAINPARDFGPRLMHALLPITDKGGSDWRYSWIPVVGPLIGGLLGAFLHHHFYD